MGEIDYIKEKCWKIKESLPIQCSKVKNKNGDWDIIIPQMTMSYDTFQEIYSSFMYKECYGASYDYIEGKVTLSVRDEGLNRLNKNSKIKIT